MFGGMEEMQKQMQETLKGIEVEASVADGAVSIKANAARQILDVTISPELSLDDHEELEDLLLEAMNRVIGLAAEKEQEESQKMLSNLLPPGMGGLSNLFG